MSNQRTSQKRSFLTNTAPLPHVSLSTSGLLALANLTTTAQRTALTGTASWLDVLVLAPGLHYQQAAEAIGTAGVNVYPAALLPEATNLSTGGVRRVTNVAMVGYLQRVGRADQKCVVDVGNAAASSRKGAGTKRSFRFHGARGEIFGSSSLPAVPRQSLFSPLIYYTLPSMTLASVALMVSLQDWWGLAVLLALMFCRALNIYIIKQRVKEVPPESRRPNVHEDWWVVLHDDRCICLRGLAHDLEAITTGTWMRAKTNVEGYMEAASKLTVYMIAIFSGNQSQVGDIILIVLLLGTSGLLALSNEFEIIFEMNGRTACVTPGSSGSGTDPSRDSGGTVTEPNHRSTTTPSDFEKDEARTVLQTTYPFSEEVNYV
jgi:hypothetical protein